MNLPLRFLHEVPNTWHSVALAGRSSWRLLRHSRTYLEGICLAKSLRDPVAIY
jgi:hypothetical protein